jgi:nitrite reductase/ring-hydroxylating ferredoxin subunit
VSDLELLSLAAGAYLGGEEVYGVGYGVNHTAFEAPPTEFTPALREAELVDGRPRKTEVNGVPVIIVRSEDRSTRCRIPVHAGCSLSEGDVATGAITCPCHGSRFRLADGSIVHGPATVPEPSYEVRVRDGMVEVRRDSGF